MSTEVADAEAPRRGGRERKQVRRFEPSATAAGRKGKKKAVSAGEEEEGDNDEDDEDVLTEDEEDAEEATTSRPNKRAANGTKKVKAAKVPRNSKKKATNGTAVDIAADGDMENGYKTDSPFFNAMLSPDIALPPLVEEWVEVYQQTGNDEVSEKASVHELVLFFVRCCGLTANVDEDEAMDVDGVVDTIERLQDESVKVTAASYPLISKLKPLKPFRTNLDIFITNLVKTIALTPLLYEDTNTTSHSIPIMPLLLTWLNSMSSSPLRPIRHTSTYISLKIATELCDVAADVSKDLSLKQRQKETEAKKSGAGAAFQKRMKDAEMKVKEAHQRKTKLEEIMQDTFSVSFVHRVRDADPAIRADCLRELGQWMKRYPELYVRNAYLVYLSRGINDPDSHARLEAVKSLALLLSKETSLNQARSTIMRSAPRLVEMSLRDVDHQVRIQALKAVTLLDRTGILQDEQEEERNKVARLVFDHDPKVRKAVGEFVKGLWTERVEALENTVANAQVSRRKKTKELSGEEERDRLEWKALATLLLETSNSLDEATGESSTTRDTAVTNSKNMMARATAAVESLRPHIDRLTHWEGLVDYLLLDHSVSAQEIWPLSEEEEDLMLQVMVACIRADDEAEDKDEKTKTLIKVLPRLLAKNQTDVERMSALLSLPAEMNLGLYLDMRMANGYESLWDDLTKQFLQNTNLTVLTAAIQAINQLNSNTAMEASNNRKLSEMQDALFSSLRDAIHGQEVVMMDLIDDDEIATFEAILQRMSLLSQSRDLTEAMQDEEGGQSSGWEIVCAFAERGALGRKAESKIVALALKTVFIHLTWLFKKFKAEDASDEIKVSELSEKRDRLVEICMKLLLDQHTNSTDAVRREAFITYVNVHVMFSPASATPAAKACPLTIEEDVQHKLGGAFQGSVERYASDREGDRHVRQGSADPPEDEEQDEELDLDLSSPERAEQEISFIKYVAAFVAAIRCGALDVTQAKEALAHYARFGATFDAVVRKLVDVLRDRGIYNHDAEVVRAVAAEALQRSFTNFLEGNGSEPTAPIALAKLLQTAFVIQGTHFTVLKHMDSTNVYDFHNDCISYIFKPIAQYVRQSKSKDRKTHGITGLTRALTFFKPLLLLLGPVAGQQALMLRTHLDERIRGLGVTINSNKMWDSYKAYEKRLVLIASKDPNVKKASRRVAAEAEEAELTEREEEMEGEASRPAKKRRAGRRSTTHARDEVQEEEEALDDAQGEEHDEFEADGQPDQGSERNSLSPPPPVAELGDLDFGNDDFNMEDIDIDAEFEAGIAQQSNETGNGRDDTNGEHDEANGRDEGEEDVPPLGSLPPPERGRSESVDPPKKRKKITRRF